MRGGGLYIVFSLQREKPTQRVFGSREKEREFLLEPLRNAKGPVNVSERAAAMAKA